MIRLHPLMFVALCAATPVPAQDSTARNPLARPASQGNPLVKKDGDGGNPLARTAAQEAAATAELWVGTYTGKHALGPVTVEVRREGDAFVIIDRSSTPNATGKATLTADGTLKGQYVMKLLGFTKRHDVELRKEEGGFRYKTTGQSTLLTKQQDGRR